MENNYFNTHLASKSAKLVKSDPYYAREKFEEYLKEYPNDYNSWCLYISLLVELGECDLALKYFNRIEKVVNSDKKFILDPKFKYIKSRDLFYTKVKLLSYSHRYQELYDMIRYGENKYFVIDMSLHKPMTLYCRKKLGKSIDDNFVGKGYLCNQIAHYDYDSMVEHVKKHSADSGLDIPELSVFSPDFPLDSILLKIKDYLDVKNRLCVGFFDDTYYFKYDNCGRVRDRVTDYFKVICFHDSTDIVTMCPDDSAPKSPYVDLNFLVKKDSKVKSISARDRFNMRYGRK
jgi:tetratricopeptide (TPR) repeat protein